MNLKLEKQKIAEGYKYVIGCDEVGRGCLAGPVVACAVVLRPEFLNHKSYILNLKEVKDSKLLTPTKREEISKLIKKYFLWSIGIVSEKEIDQINIHNASLLAMRKAVEGLSSSGVILNLSASESEESKTSINRSFVGCTPQDNAFLFIDGKFLIPNFPVTQEAIVGGDNKVMSIAAASIIAKVHRDELMQKLDKQFTEYEFGKHKGYATLLHRSKIKEHGLSPVHRKSFCKNYIV